VKPNTVTEVTNRVIGQSATEKKRKKNASQKVINGETTQTPAFSKILEYGGRGRKRGRSPQGENSGLPTKDQRQL